jgi:hypothetical protein
MSPFIVFITIIIYLLFIFARLAEEPAYKVEIVVKIQNELIFVEHIMINHWSPLIP